MMIAMMVATLAASAPASNSTRIQLAAQGEARVRILNSVRYRVGSDQAEDGKPARTTEIRSEDGGRVPAMLVEFE